MTKHTQEQIDAAIEDFFNLSLTVSECATTTKRIRTFSEKHYNTILAALNHYKDYHDHIIVSSLEKQPQASNEEALEALDELQKRKFYGRKDYKLEQTIRQALTVTKSTSQKVEFALDPNWEKHFYAEIEDGKLISCSNAECFELKDKGII